ncbi:SAVED domain-containing protein [Pseudarthrobacter sp. CCNWLW207]|uniref:SAVED domain-containing protein n=1 Tax=Pseudarthrobacter sp. CCNWLW207 TaxID=3127468 RepID=UPI003077722A
MAEERDTKIARSNIPDNVRERIWGRAAARCVLCSEWLIDSTEFWHSVPTGEIAHNVGATSGPNSSRSKSTLTAEERAYESNLFLLCHTCHKKIDSRHHRDSYTVDFLAAKKKEHEDRVRQVTDFATLRPATVIRLAAAVRGTFSPVPPAQVAEALRREGLTGMGDDTRNGIFDISLPDPESATWSWARAEDQINKTVDRVFEAIGAEDTSVLSVFAIAPVPVLIYLGSRLDDKTETVLHRRKRADTVDTWAWPSIDSLTTSPAFVVEDASTPSSESVVAAANEVVVLVSVTARVSGERIPEALADMPVLELRPGTLTPGPDLIDSRTALNAFAESWRVALSLLEATYPNARKIHLIAAVPNTAAITMGRHHMRDAHPDLVLYQRNKDNSYEPVMEITT